MSEYLRHVHLSGCDGAFDEHRELNFGKINLVKVINTIENLGENISYVLEVSGNKNRVEKSITYLEKNGLIEKKQAIIRG